MKLLVLCFLGVVATTAGTIFFEGTVQHICQTGFLVAAGVSIFFWLLGRI